VRHGRRGFGAAAAAGALTVLALAGCDVPPGTVPAGLTPAAPAGRLEVVQVAPLPPGVGQPYAARIERVRSVARNGYSWTVPSLDPASAVLRLDWVDGATLECGEADRVQVQETEDAVVIGVEATRADRSRVCAASGVPRTATLRLRHPVGTRALLEPASGSNDGLPRTADARTPPEPRCTSDAVRDVPIGMRDATARLAPRGAVRALVCRTSWPKGRARTDALRIDDPSAVAALVAAFDTVRDLHPASDPVASCRRSKGAVYAVHLQGKGVRVEVRADEIDCATVTNGAATGTMTPELVRALDALLPR
jgi:hypothetical protein